MAAPVVMASQVLRVARVAQQIPAILQLVRQQPATAAEAAEEFITPPVEVRALVVVVAQQSSAVREAREMSQHPQVWRTLAQEEAVRDLTASGNLRLELVDLV